jgi:hypothetical protein
MMLSTKAVAVVAVLAQLAVMLLEHLLAALVVTVQHHQLLAHQ